MVKESILPLNLQFFAEPPAEPVAASNANTTPPASAPEIDYEKIASIITGKQKVAEETVLKSYFKEQGLSQEEMTQAIASFKEQKAKNTPDVDALQSQLTQARQEAKEAVLGKEAYIQALTLGVDNKSIPYVLKLADLDKAIGEDGKVNAEELKKAINKVLEDVPQFKPASDNSAAFNNTGFQIGSPGSNNVNNNTEEMLKGIFGIRK